MKILIIGRGYWLHPFIILMLNFAGNVKMESLASSGHHNNLREKDKQVCFLNPKLCDYFLCGLLCNLVAAFQGVSAQEERRRKQQNVILSPQAGM